MVLVSVMWQVNRRPLRRGHWCPPLKSCKSWVEAVVFVNVLWQLTLVCLAKVTDVHLAKVHILIKLTAVQFVNGLRPSTDHVLVNWFNLATTKCHVCALFVHGLWLSINSPAPKWDVTVPCFIRQHKQLYLTSLNICRQICTCMTSTGNRFVVPPLLVQ